MLGRIFLFLLSFFSVVTSADTLVIGSTLDNQKFTEIIAAFPAPEGTKIDVVIVDTGKMKL